MAAMLFFREPHTLKKSLTEISTTARENLARQQRIIGTDTKRLNSHGYVNEDALLGDQFKSLEVQINALQLECLTSRHQIEVGGRPHLAEASCEELITPGTSAIGSDEVTLWNALESQYDYLLKTMVNESLDDSMRIAICDLWDSDLKDWEESLKEFEKSLDTNWSWHEDGKGRRLTRRESPQKIRSQERITLNGISPRERLLLNWLSKSPEDRNLDTISEIVKLSCEALGDENDHELLDTCAEIWDVIITLCGVQPKNRSSSSGSTLDDLRDVVYNSLRGLEDLCRRQLLHQLGVAQECVTGEELLERLKQFCSMDGHPSFPNQSGHLWQLLYWCVRCGSMEALTALLNIVPQYQYLFQFQELDLFEAIGFLLNDKLFNTSRSQNVQRDSVWRTDEIRVRFSEQPQHDKLSPSTRNGNITLDELLDLLNSQRIPLLDIHTTLPFLVSLLHAESGTISLREHMPNATAEDFLWYNFHLAILKPLSNLPHFITKLQRRLLQAGPKHFGSGDSNCTNLTFAKIASMALAPTASIDWLLQARPDLSILCLQWLTYLTQFGICGSQDSLIGTQFPDLHQFIGSLSLSEAFSDILVSGQSPIAANVPDVALQFCELLPFKSRVNVVSLIFKLISLRMFNDPQLESQLLGTISEDGSGEGGLLYRVLMAKAWDSDLSDREKAKNEGRSDFEGLVACLAEEAADSNFLMSAVRLSYLISQDRSCMSKILDACVITSYYCSYLLQILYVLLEFLLKLFSDPQLFDSHQSSLPQPSEHQKEAIKFYNIYAGRISSGELPDLGSTFELLRIARQCVSVYLSASHGLLWDAWNTIIGISSPESLDLFPRSGLVQQWKNSELESHIPRLIEVCARCLQFQLDSIPNQNGKPSASTDEGIKEKAEILLDSCMQMTNNQYTIQPDTIRLLRNLLVG